MSRRRLGAPSDPRQPRRVALGARLAGVWLVTRILAREAGVGWALWHAAAHAWPLNVLAGAAVPGLCVVVVRAYPLTPPRGWGGTLLEAAVLLVGGVCIANILRLLLGVPPDPVP